MDKFIDEMTESLRKSHTEESKVWANKRDVYDDIMGKMKTWMKERSQYLNTEINKF